MYSPYWTSTPLTELVQPILYPVPSDLNFSSQSQAQVEMGFSALIASANAGHAAYLHECLI